MTPVADGVNLLLRFQAVRSVLFCVQRNRYYMQASRSLGCQWLDAQLLFASEPLDKV
jgi:hypothetical protein